ncbi:hypothetical protein [Streptomyces sp. NPDC000229]|uniref:hypothetical protein n=1 Tax=Streptomyces sp. NPDC000229 TaxID=3154247 RepID=UPI003316B9B9
MEALPPPARPERTDRRTATHPEHGEGTSYRRGARAARAPGAGRRRDPAAQRPRTDEARSGRTTTRTHNNLAIRNTAP